MLALSGATLAAGLAGCTSSSSNESNGGDTTTDKQELEPSDWEDVDEIRLEGYTRGWYGVEPDPIANVRNPAILLFEGDEYEITRENADAGTHNIAIWDDARQVVDGSRTRTVRDRGATQSLRFEATAAAHQYVCEPHASQMRGYFKVVD